MAMARSFVAALALALLAAPAGGEGEPDPVPASLAPSSPGFRTPWTVERIRAQLEATALPSWTKVDVRSDGIAIDVIVWLPHEGGVDSDAASDTCRAVFRAVADATDEQWARRHATRRGRGLWNSFVLAGHRSGKCSYS